MMQVSNLLIFDGEWKSLACPNMAYLSTIEIQLSSPLDKTIYHYVDTFIDRIRDGISLKGTKAVRENLRLLYVAWRAIAGLMNSILSILNDPYVVILVLTLSQWIGRINISLSSLNDPSR